MVAFSGISRNSHCQLLYHFRIFNVFIGNSKAITDTGTSALIMFATYPQVKLNPTMTLVLSTIIPSLIISIFPLQILRYSSSYYLLLLFIATAVFLLLSLVTYKQGLKRYESSNSINLNV
ncbi:membrane protein of unknown function [Brochothrix thermosphacta]|nr:membrane protein of unknown function [Brochothrix thermosphacta]